MTRFRLLLLLVAVLGTIGCDRVTKHVATTTLAGKPSRSYLGGTVWLGYAENRGGFLSLGASLPASARAVIFTGLTGLMLIGVTALGFRRRWRGWYPLGLAVFVAGGASNWVDRAVRGSVVDFMHVGIGPVRTGIFNVADVAIMLGAIIVALVEVRHTPDVPRTERQT